MATDSFEKMGRAYQIAGKAFRERLRAERPEDERELTRVAPAEVVSVRGQYDHSRLVLEATSVPFVCTDPEGLAGLDWDRMQVLLVDCPGRLSGEALARIAPWVRRGGYLVTTDWAVRHVIEPVFPGTIRHNGQETADHVVRVHGEPGEPDPLLAGFLEEGRDPLWWLESSSYPIQVLDASRVRVLLRSRELGERWGADPVAVTFDEGEGTVLHLVSHVYLQRSDVRNARDAQAPVAYFKNALKFDDANSARLAERAGGLHLSDLESAYTSADLASRVILESRKKRAGRAKQGGQGR